jgi:hypothetical protein
MRFYSISATGHQSVGGSSGGSTQRSTAHNGMSQQRNSSSTAESSALQHPASATRRLGLWDSFQLSAFSSSGDGRRMSSPSGV